MVDHNAFLIWKNEAFSSWIDNWSIIYGLDSPQFNFLLKCHDSFYLVNVVDNDYIEGDLNNVINAFIEENQTLIRSL